MITGIHALIYSPDAARVRALLRDVIGWQSVDAGGGWPIFALPPAEVAVHPVDDAGDAPRQELFLMCDDLDATIAEFGAKGVELARPVTNQAWGASTAIKLPGGGELGLYQPRHPTALGLGRR